MKPVLMPMALTVAALAAAPTAGADIVSFVSPSGNIACMSDLAYVRCDIRDRNWAPPPKAADCPDFTGWGQGLQLSASGPAEFVCAGDTTFGDTTAYVLEYGRTHSLPGYACTSGADGITCTNRDDHGFIISREAYRLF